MLRIFLPPALLAAIAFGQAPTPAPPAPVVSPEVRADRTVTFRFRAPYAHEVAVALEGAPRLAMQKGEDGVWSATTQPLTPDIYGYSFVADGVSLVDPGNPVMKPNLLNTTSAVHVPGAGLPWELAGVPRGRLHHHFYRSTAADGERDFFVYTPPGYDPAARRLYPVLYLLHGFSDDARGWTDVGRAHVILDNLIAQRKAAPMLVVMPLGYGTMELVTRGAQRDMTLRRKSFIRFREALLTEVVPEVERSYRAAKNREQRAIAGLSMGGAESLYIGLNAVDRFAYIGAFSAGPIPEDWETAFPSLDAKSSKPLQLLWIACGTEDRLIDANRKFKAWLGQRGVAFKPVETPGEHTWMVWRRNLAEFVPLLFGGAR